MFRVYTPFATPPTRHPFIQMSELRHSLAKLHFKFRFVKINPKTIITPKNPKFYAFS